jgi:hypothetical protein
LLDILHENKIKLAFIKLNFKTKTKRNQLIIVDADSLYYGMEWYNNRHSGVWLSGLVKR